MHNPLEPRLKAQSPPLPTLATLFLTLALLWALFQPLLSGDLGWHIRVGQFWLERGSVPVTNFLCYPALAHTWVTHEWLSGVIFALLDQTGGLPLLMLARGLLFVATLGGLYQLGRRLGAEPLALAGLLLLSMLTLALHVSLRPWLFSNLLLVVCLLLTERIRRQSAATGLLWWYVALLGLWINLHGGFVVGLALFGLTLLEWVRQGRRQEGLGGRRQRLWRALGFGLVTLLVLLLNPHGLEGLLLPIRYALGESQSGLAMTREIKEWGPLELDSLFGGIWMVWLGLGILALSSSPVARRRPEVPLALLFCVLSLQAVRHLPIAGLLLFPAIAEGVLEPLGRWLRRQSRAGLRFVAGLSALEDRASFGALVVLVGLALGLYGLDARDPAFEQNRMRAKGYPLTVVQALAQLPPQPLLNHYDWAGLIAWKAPEQPLFITPVNDAYPRTLFEDWQGLLNLSPGWEKQLNAYEVARVLLPSTSALVHQLKRHGDWNVLLEADGASLLERQPRPPLDLPSPSTPSHASEPLMLPRSRQ